MAKSKSKTKTKKISANSILLAVLYIVIGILFIAFRSSLLKWALTISGVLAIAYGVYLLLQKQWLNGILFIALGLVLILGGWLFIEFILLIFGIVLIIYGIKDLIFEFKKGKKSIFGIIVACLTILAGILLIVSKWVVLDWLFIIIGIVLIADGVMAFLNK